MNMDGVLGMGFIIGVVSTLIVVCIVLISNRKDENDSISEGTPNGSNSIRSGNNNGNNTDRYIHMDSWNFDKGSEEEMEELEKLAHELYVMKMVTGLCWKEKENLDKARLYIEREMKSFNTPVRDRILIKWLLQKQYNENTDIETVYKKWKEFMEEKNND